jgi:hypothetical protein
MYMALLSRSMAMPVIALPRNVCEGKARIQYSHPPGVCGPHHECYWRDGNGASAYRVRAWRPRLAANGERAVEGEVVDVVRAVRHAGVGKRPGRRLD